MTKTGRLPTPVLAACAVLLTASAGRLATQQQDTPLPTRVSSAITVTLAVVAPDAPPVFRAGSRDVLRVVYDPRDVDAETGRVRIRGLQNLLDSSWTAPGGQPASKQSALSVADRNIGFQRAVTHGAPILIALTPLHCSAVSSLADGHPIFGGPYVLDATGPVGCNATSWRSTGEC